MSRIFHTASEPSAPKAPLAWPSHLVESLLRASLIGQQLDLGVKPPATRSYAHPNGFAKIALGECVKSSARLFLHVWTDDFCDSDIHNHRWHFTSIVVHGRLANRQYSAFPANGAKLIRCRYTPAQEGTSFRLVPVDDPVVAAIQQSQTTLDQGDSYSQTAEVFHTAHSSKMTATLMARGRPVSTSAVMLLRPSDERLNTNFDRSLLPLIPDQVKEQVEQVLSWLAG